MLKAGPVCRYSEQVGVFLGLAVHDTVWPPHRATQVISVENDSDDSKVRSGSQ